MKILRHRVARLRRLQQTVQRHLRRGAAGNYPVTFSNTPCLNANTVPLLHSLLQFSTSNGNIHSVDHCARIARAYSTDIIKWTFNSLERKCYWLGFFWVGYYRAFRHPKSVDVLVVVVT